MKKTFEQRMFDLSRRLKPRENTMKRRCLAIAIAAGCAVPAVAEESNVLGVGYMNCAKLSQMYHDAPPQYGNQVLDVMVGSWAAGFMSGTNMALSIGGQDTKNLSAIPMEQQIVRIRKFCKQHPDKDVMIGVADLFGSLPSNADGK